MELLLCVENVLSLSPIDNEYFGNQLELRRGLLNYLKVGVSSWEPLAARHQTIPRIRVAVSITRHNFVWYLSNARLTHTVYF